MLLLHGLHDGSGSFGTAINFHSVHNPKGITEAENASNYVAALKCQILLLLAHFNAFKVDAVSMDKGKGLWETLAVTFHIKPDSIR